MHRLLFPVMMVVAVGCQVGSDPNDPGQFGEESNARCEPSARTPLAADEVSALGFSPQQLLDLVGPDVTVPLVFEDGTSTDLDLSVVVSGVYELVDYAYVTDGDGGAEPAMSCASQVELEVTVGFATADGLFSESFDTRITSADGATVSAWRQLDTVSGTFDVWDFAPDGNDWDDLEAWVSFSWTADGPAGRVEGQGSGTDGEVAFAEALPIATWGNPE